MKWSDRLYFGTWLLERQLKELLVNKIEGILFFALDSGIRRFDTAAVYGGGKIEEILGVCLPKDSVIVTKIPAITKPYIQYPSPIQEFYSRNQINRSVEGSLNRLRRTSVDTILLHNWLPSWSSDAIEILQCLREIKEQGIARRVGISLPDNFLSHIEQEVLSYVDVIEAPFNPEQSWVLKQLPTLIRLKKEVILRSLFGQGKLLTEYSAESLVQDALKLGTSVVIGMTTEGQIIQNVSYLKGGK